MPPSPLRFTDTVDDVWLLPILCLFPFFYWTHGLREKRWKTSSNIDSSLLWPLTLPIVFLVSDSALLWWILEVVLLVCLPKCMPGMLYTNYFHEKIVIKLTFYKKIYQPPQPLGMFIICWTTFHYWIQLLKLVQKITNYLNCIKISNLF